MPNVREVRFESEGVELIGNLFVPEGRGPWPAVVLQGPLTSVKEQVTGNYAAALAERGFVALSFDHRFFGQSGGEPRQYESPTKKREDVRNALSFLAAQPEVDAAKLAAVGVCAGGGYMAETVAIDDRVKAFAAVAGFFHDVEQQRKWMGDGYDAALANANAARERWERNGELESIPAVGKGDEPVAMPLAEAFEYYGTERGAVPNYVNRFAVLSRADTLPYDAQQHAAAIRVPTLIIHSDKAMAPMLARKFYDGLAGPKSLSWTESNGQIDFYDDPAMIEPAADRIAEHFRAAL
jgi:uncharacterized protein